jgi:hypothetical protein
LSNYDVSKKEYKEIKNHIFEQFLGDENQKNPELTAVLGQNASGKTCAIRDALKAAKPNRLTTVDKDDFLDFHPKIEEIYNKFDKKMPEIVNDFNSKCEKDVLNEALKRKTSILLQSTGRVEKVITEQLKLAKKNGYKTKVVVIATNVELSKLGVIQRYNENKIKDNAIARYVNPNTHDQAYNNLPDTVKAIHEKGLADIKIQKRDGTVLYDSTKDEFKSKNPADVLKADREKGLSENEKNFFFDNIDRQIQISESLGNKDDVKVLKDLKLSLENERESVNTLLNSIEKSSKDKKENEKSIKKSNKRKPTR